MHIEGMLERNSFERGNAASYLPEESWCGGFALWKGTMKTTRWCRQRARVCKQPNAVAEKEPVIRGGFLREQYMDIRTAASKVPPALKKACAEAGRETVAGAGRIVL